MLKVLPRSQYANILEKAPTLLGLERLIRYCLLAFMDGNGFPGIRRIANGGGLDVGKGQIEQRHEDD